MNPGQVNGFRQFIDWSENLQWKYFTITYIGHFILGIHLKIEIT